MLPQMTLPTVAARTPDRSQLLEKAKEIEEVFLSEMLAHAGLDESSEEFGGGMAEDQLSSFLRNAQVKQIVESGGLGLAQTIFEALVKREQTRHVETY